VSCLRAPFNLAGSDEHFSGPFLYYEDGGGRFIHNTVKHLRDWCQNPEELNVNFDCHENIKHPVFLHSIVAVTSITPTEQRNEIPS
jgi:hypothetical protein